MEKIVKGKFFTGVEENFNVMSSLVMKQIGLIKMLLDDNDAGGSIYTEINTNEVLLDSLDVKMRREVINAIVLYNPRASHLRLMMSNYDMIGYMERVGDLVKNIARFLKDMDIKGPIFRHYKSDIMSMIELASDMVERSFLSFDYKDNAMARKIIKSDDEVDGLYHRICRITSTDYGDKALSVGQLNDLFGINGIAYNIERIGDNATNIAEAAIYFAEGRDVKHEKSMEDSGIKKDEE
ncbi:MAG: DUF47 family protein [Bacteroidales bacterium]|jgi:phosphate transport system protein|nr:DUF47 family protein [Bacteroidales bacterium]